MHNRRPAYPGHLRFARNTFAVIAAALLGYRIERAAHISTADAITSILTGIALVGATATGCVVRLRQLRDRAEHAEKKVIELRANLLEGDEDKALWDSVDAPADDPDTIAFNRNVVPLNQYQARKAG